MEYIKEACPATVVVSKILLQRVKFRKIYSAAANFQELTTMLGDTVKAPPAARNKFTWTHPRRGGELILYEYLCTSPMLSRIRICQDTYFVILRCTTKQHKFDDNVLPLLICFLRTAKLLIKLSSNVEQELYVPWP